MLHFVLILHVVSACSATYTSTSHVIFNDSTVYADDSLLWKQKFLFEILRNVYQPLENEEFKPFFKSWISDELKYKDFPAVSKFFQLFNGNFLQKGEIFTIFDKWHLYQTRLLFNLLYYSIDWDTYKSNVIWARENVNEGMFIFAVSLSVIHRKDLQGVELPAIYEINPYLFFNGDLIHGALFRKLRDLDYGFYDGNIRNAASSNYTSKFTANHHDEGDLAYYTEDIGMNSYYFYYMLEYPTFLGGDDFGLDKDRRGELFLYMHQQLLSWYYLERQSNSLGSIEMLDWKFPLKTGYYSMLRYWNGVPFRSREHFFTLNKDDYVKLDQILEYEHRFKETIDRGYYILSNGTRVDLRTSAAVDVLGNMINSNVDSIDQEYFQAIEMQARSILGRSSNYQLNDELWPGPTMHYETSMRDPLFYQYVERMLGLYWQYKSYLPPYTYDELNFNGVEIKNLVVDKLITFFEYYHADISNGLPFNSNSSPNRSTWNFTVFARQKRLNHKPFGYALTVHSNFTGKGVIRTYMGPKFSNIRQLTILKKYYVEMDQFLVDLVKGENIIKRNTRDFYYNIRDRTTYTELYKQILRAINEREKFVLDMSEAHCGWPDRLLLPRGLPNGYEISFFFIISPYQEPQVTQYSTFTSSISCGVGSGSKYIDDLPFGYPFDREIDAGYFITKNMIFHNVMIYRVNESKMNKTTK
ncbi:hexamerin-1.1-like [Malaya genurostris]|uniref:hexamerin-1.1-like n=1 Tax=Malaya genurostris TaxID=325434 RepID=UPI0026F37FDB|nr:hexamerin-1.1-like [Malaya genurostris]